MIDALLWYGLFVSGGIILLCFLECIKHMEGLKLTSTIDLNIMREMNKDIETLNERLNDTIKLQVRMF